jgi:SHOCT-like domain
MPDDRARILEMLQRGKITVDEAERLLDAVGTAGAEAGGPASPPPPPPPRKPRRLVVRITDTRTGKVKTNVRLPFVGWGLLNKLTRSQLGRRLREHGADLDRGELGRAARGDKTGHIVDVTDEESGERVEVLFE